MRRFAPIALLALILGVGLLVAPAEAGHGSDTQSTHDTCRHCACAPCPQFAGNVVDVDGLKVLILEVNEEGEVLQSTALPPADSE